MNKNGIKKFRKQKFGKEEVVLQITSMADIFVILLVYLLKTFSVGITEISPHNEVALPQAVGAEPVVEMLKLEVSSNLVLLDSQPVTRLHQFKFDPSDIEQDGTSRSINAWFMNYKKNRSPAALNEESHNRLLLLADRDTPYATIKTVLSSAAGTGFESFKLLVVEEN